MIKSYVKRLGKFTDAQKKAYELFSNDFLIPFNENIDNKNFIDFEKAFGNSNEVTLEIGFGSGLATAEIAEANPDKNYLGVEVHKPGIGRLLQEIKKRNLLNIRIIEYDAIHVVLKMIPKNSLNAIHIFFPDPWQKKRHKKRRLVQRPFTQNLSECLKPQGYLYMVTDWEDYAFHALEELNATPLLKNMYEGFAEPQEWRPKTRFEEKGLAKEHVIRELMFIRK
jgi:tRNA (guanine-N7-)-methyltransferase